MEKLKKLLKDKKLSEREAIKIINYYIENKKFFGRPKERHYLPVSLSINMIKRKNKLSTLKEAINFYMKSDLYKEHINEYGLKRLEYPALAKIVNEVQKRESKLLGIMSLAAMPKKRTKKLSE
tara:strand:+ start:130 stop:498 length:369 start_codon:yes stop_codon:yes gene_type:complete